MSQVQEESLMEFIANDDHSKTYSSSKLESLTDEETQFAINDLVISYSYPKIERSFIDPLFTDQKIGLISFQPSKGATPNDKGIYGLLKLRGNFSTEEQANKHARDLIKDVNSIDKIYHVSVGKPFPITDHSLFSKIIEEIDINDESKNKEIHQKAQEKRDIQEIKDREKSLRSEHIKDDDPLNEYIVLRTKKAQLMWDVKKYNEKISEMEKILITLKNNINVFEKEHPTFKKTFLERYLEARKEVGLSTEQSSENFLGQLCEEDEEE